MSLSQEPLFSKLRNRFICGYRNIIGEPYAGDSGIHGPRGNAVDTTNGAGPHNLQLFIINADGVVLHCLPGFWSAADLSDELDFAERLNRIWSDRSITPNQKAELFKREQLDHIRLHSPDMVARSQLQGFDKRFEALHRHRTSDAIADMSLIDPQDAHGPLPAEAFKTTDVIMHQRMARRPFQPYEAFDVAVFADYGTMVYDKQEDNLDEAGRIIDHEARLPLIKAGVRNWAPQPGR